MAFECQDSFLINFAASLLCTFEITNADALSVAVGRTTFNYNYTFTRGTRTTGVFDDVVGYSVDGAASVAIAPAGVAFSGAFNTAPDFTAGAREAQNGIYSGYIEINDPADPTPFVGTSLAVTIQIGLDI
jgi:hypothetical protein